jgi:hypothetical protein
MLKSVNSFYDPSLPTLPKNTFSEFGRQLKMAMQNDLDYLLKESNTNEDTREVLFKNVSKEFVRYIVRYSSDIT